MSETIPNTETDAEEPQSFEPHNSEHNSQTTATIVHDGGSEVVSGFTFIEELHYEYGDPYVPKTIRVWYSDPADNDDDYVDYEDADVTEVSP